MQGLAVPRLKPASSNPASWELFQLGLVLINLDVVHNKWVHGVLEDGRPEETGGVDSVMYVLSCLGSEIGLGSLCKRTFRSRLTLAGLPETWLPGLSENISR